MNSQLPRPKIILRPEPPNPPAPPTTPSTPPPKPRITRARQPPRAPNPNTGETNTNPLVCSDSIMNSCLEPARAVEITSYCWNLLQMPLSAAVIGFGLDADTKAATDLQNYLRSPHVRQGLHPMAVEIQVLRWLAGAVAPPVVPLPPLWQAMAVKCMISGVKHGRSLVDVHTHPDLARFLVLAGWTREQAEMVRQYDYGPPSPLIVRPSAAPDPFEDDGEGGLAWNGRDAFKINYLYGRDCHLPKVLLPRDRQPRSSIRRPPADRDRLGTSLRYLVKHLKNQRETMLFMLLSHRTF